MATKIAYEVVFSMINLGGPLSDRLGTVGQQLSEEEIGKERLKRFLEIGAVRKVITEFDPPKAEVEEVEHAEEPPTALDEPAPAKEPKTKK